MARRHKQGRKKLCTKCKKKATRKGAGFWKNVRKTMFNKYTVLDAFPTIAQPINHLRELMEK